MAMSVASLEELIFGALMSEMDGSHPEVIKGRRKLAKALATAIVTAIQSSLQDSTGGKCV